MRSLIPAGSGITAEPEYYGEIFTNARGGITTRGATQYFGLFTLPVTIEPSQCDLPIPGRIRLLGQNTHGRGLSENYVGAFQTVSNIDSFDNIMQVSEFWWEVPFFDGDLAVRLGKQDVNTDFLLIDQAQDFVQSSFGLAPSAGLPSYPDPAMAAVVLADLSPGVRLKAGYWDLFADGDGWGFSENELTLAIAELQVRYALDGGRLPGAIDLGAFHAADGEFAGARFPSISGVYLQVEQFVWREPSSTSETPQGLGLFGSWAPRFVNRPVPVTAISDSFFAGLVYRGPLRGRNHDVTGAGVAWARLNQQETSPETVIEVFYKMQLTPSITLQPDLQYVSHPSGVFRDALVLGVRFQVAL